MVFHRGLGSSRRYRRGGSKAPGSPRARARSRCRRSSTSRTRGGRAAGPRGVAESGEHGKAQAWRIPVGRNRLPGQCLLQACEGSPALVTTGAMAPHQVGFCSTQQEQLHCQQSALRPALAVSSPKPSSRSPFPWFQNSPAAPSRFLVFFKPYSPSWLSPFPGLSESSWMVPQHTFQRVSSFLSLLHPGHRYLLLGEVVKVPREQPHRGVSTCPGLLHPPPGWVSAVVALGLQGRGSL